MKIFGYNPLQLLTTEQAPPIRVLHPVTGMPLGHGENPSLKQLHAGHRTSTLIQNKNPKPVLPARLHAIETDEGTGLVPKIKSGYVERLKDFAGAQSGSIALSVFGTALISQFTDNPAALLIAGPFMEKFGFIGWEFYKEARHPSSDLSYYDRSKKMLAGFFNNLKTDVIFHDLMSYTPLMALGMYLLPEWSPTWATTLVSGVAFTTGIFTAPKWEQLAGELLHKSLRKTAENKNLNVETYYETRYVLNEHSNPQEIFDSIAEKFDLTNKASNVYEDQYYENTFPQLSERKLVTRDRKIYDENGQVQYHHNLDIFTTKPNEIPVGEYNIYEVEKEKAFIPIEDILSVTAKVGSKLQRRLTHSPGELIAFRRQVAFNDKVRMALDIVYVSENEAYYVIEFKGYPHTRSELYELVLHFKNNFGSQATILSKNDIIKHLRSL